MQGILLQIRYFERELSKSLKKFNFIFPSNRMSSIYHSYTIRMSLVCHLFVLICICMSLVYTRMSFVCDPYVTRIYSYVICTSLICGFTMNVFTVFRLKTVASFFQINFVPLTSIFTRISNIKTYKCHYEYYD